MKDKVNEEDFKKEEKSVVGNGVVMEKAARGARSVHVAREAGGDIQRIAEQYKNCTPECTAGRIAEKVHEGTFNMDAVRKGRSDLRARTTASNGQPHDKADIEILKNGQVIDGAQVKYHNSAVGTTFQISDPKYDGLQKVCPADQASRVRELAQKRGESGIGQRNYPDTAKRASDHIKKEGIKSEPLSYKNAVDMAKNPAKMVKDLLAKESVRAVSGGSLFGAAASGTMSIVENVTAVIRDEKKAGDAIKSVAKETLKGAADGAAKSAASLAVQAGLIRAGTRTLAKGSAPVAIAVTGVDILKDAGHLATGKIDVKEFGVRSGKNVVKGGAGLGGMKAGGAIGTIICPGPGTIIGGIIGGIGAGFLADLLLS